MSNDTGFPSDWATNCTGEIESAGYYAFLVPAIRHSLASP